MPAPANLVGQTSIGTGTGNLTLVAANGLQTFATAFGTGATTNVFDYFISNKGAAEWERGTGHMSNSTTLVRDTVIESSNSNAAVSFSAGTKDVTNDAPAQNQVLYDGAVTSGFAILAGAIPYSVSPSNTASANTTALNSAIAAAKTFGGKVIIPPGQIKLNALTTIASANNLVLEGQGDYANGTELQFQNATGDNITFSGCNHSGLRDVWITAGARRTSGFGVTFTGGCFEPFTERVRFDYGYNGIFVDQATEYKQTDTTFRYMLGIYGVIFGGGASSLVSAARLIRCSADNPYPVAIGSVITRSNTTPGVTLGQIALINGGIWQVTQSGTTGSTAPSTIPGSTASDWISTDFTDGTVKWRYISSSSLCWMVVDSFAYSIATFSCAFIDGINAVKMVDTQNTGSSYPKWVENFDLEVDHPYTDGVLLSAGESFWALGSWIGSSLTNSGVDVSSTFLGGLNLSGGTRIVGNWFYGVLLNAGPVDNSIIGCTIAANSQAGSATAHGIGVAANATKFNIIGNTLGRDPDGSGSQGYGVAVFNGTSDYYNIIGNNCEGNVTSGVFDGGSGTNKTVFANNAAVVSYSQSTLFGGYLGSQKPTTFTGTSSTVGVVDGSAIYNASGTHTTTLPAASSYPGRWLTVKSSAAQTINSASSNVCPIGSATPGTALLTNTAGKWASLQSDGTNWIIMAAN